MTPNHKGVHHFIHGVTHGRHQLASCGLGRQVFVWSLDSADLLKSLEGHNANVSQLAYDRKSDLLISLDTSGEMRTWDFATLARVHIMALRPDALEKPTAILYDAAHQARRAKLASTTNTPFRSLRTFPLRPFFVHMTVRVSDSGRSIAHELTNGP